MNCLRCGAEVEDARVFCPKCLEDMARDPVPPDTPVYIPPRRSRPERGSQPSRKSQREQIRDLRRSLWWVSIFLAIAIAACAALGVLLGLCIRFPAIYAALGGVGV